MSRSVHDDTAGRELSPDELAVQSCLIDMETAVSQAITRGKNFLEQHPHLKGPPWFLVQRIWDLDNWARGSKGVRKAQGLL